MPALAPMANTWNAQKEPRPTSTQQTRGPVSVDDTIDDALRLETSFLMFLMTSMPRVSA